MYLEFDEFKELTGLSDDFKDSFDKYYMKACNVLDNVTGRFYQLFDIETDVPFRAKQFKLALCSQIIYFSEMKASTFEGLNKSPQSVSLGRTSISNGSRYNSTGANESKQLESEDIYIYLEGTGLLYRGVCQ